MKPKAKFQVSTLASFIFCTFIPLSHAQTSGTWTLDGSGNWSTSGNWAPGSIASGASQLADFSTLDITGDHVVTIDAPYTIGTLLSQDATTATHNWTLGGPNALTLDNGASKPVLNVINQSLAISAPLDGINGFQKNGTGNLVLSGGGAMTGNVIVSAGSVQLGADNGISTSAGLEVFGGTSASRVLDLNGSDQTLSSFVFNGSNVPGNLTINGGATSKLTVNTTTNTELGPAGAMTANRLVTVDMSALGGFEWNGAANTFRVGVRAVTSSNSSSGVNPNATVTLATDNTITTAQLAIGTQGASSNGGNSILRLGQTNLLSANTINIGTGGRNNATLEFNTGLTNPTATIRATDGTSRVTTWDVGRVLNVSQTTTWTSTVDFSTGQLDALVTTLRIGRADTAGNNNRIGTENGTFSMGKGSLDVTTLIIGQYAGANTTSVATTFNGNGTFNLTDAAGKLTAENIILADNVGLAALDLGEVATTSGTFNLSAGTLEAKTIDKGADTGNATSTTRNLNFTSGTIRNYAGFDLAIANVPINLIGSGPRTFEATAGQSITVASTSGISGAGQGFTKTGTGTLSLQGANTYTGPTDVQAGTLAISNSFPNGSIFTVDAAATLELANVTLIGQPALDIDGTLNLTGPVTVGGPLTTIPGTLANVLQYGNLTGAVNLGHNYRSANFTVGATSADLNVAAGLPLTWTGAGGNSWDVNNTVSWKDASNNPEKFFWADSVTFDSAGSGTPNVNLTAEMQAAAVTVSEATVDYVFSGSGFISGPAGLTKNGAAKLTIATNNTNTGTTTINAGTLEIGNGGTTGWMGSGDIVNDASMVFNRSNDMTVANAISGTGSVTKLGAGVMRLTADNSYAGGTINGKLTNGTHPWGLNVLGPNTWTLTNSTNDYTGTTTVSGGTLALGADNVLPDATAVTLGAGTLNAATFDDTVGTLDCSGAATINLGTGGTLAFLDSSTVDWTGGTLTITGTFVPGNGVDPLVGTNPGSLRFGTTNGGLNATQLASISAPGWTGFALDDYGYLTATAALGYASWASVNGAGANLNDDHDNDGVDNGVEYFIGGPNGNTTGFTALPGVINTGGILSVTWTKAGDYAGTYGNHFVVETSDSLDGAWAVEASPGNVTISGSNVTYTFPSPLGTKRFARLKVTGP